MVVRRDQEGVSGRVRHPKRVKADAYAFASESRYSPEISKLQRIERFGLEAVTGRRVFLFSEIRRLTHAENVVNAYQSSQRSKNWAEWSKTNPQLAEILFEASKLDASRNTDNNPIQQ